MESDVDGSARIGALFSLLSEGGCSRCGSVDGFVVAEVMLGANVDEEVDEIDRRLEDERNDLVV